MIRLRGCLYKPGVNGFGPRGMKVPYSKQFNEAGENHDTAYDFGGDKWDRLIADEDLLADMAKESDNDWQVLVAIIYYWIARALGWLFFNYTDKD